MKAIASSKQPHSLHEGSHRLLLWSLIILSRKTSLSCQGSHHLLKGFHHLLEVFIAFLRHLIAFLKCPIAISKVTLLFTVMRHIFLMGNGWWVLAACTGFCWGFSFLGCWERHLEWNVRTYKFWISTYSHAASSGLDSGIWLADASGAGGLLIVLGDVWWGWCWWLMPSEIGVWAESIGLQSEPDSAWWYL